MSQPGKHKLDLVELSYKITELVFLSVLTVVFSIPIVTLGASVTAMHYVLLKIYRDEEGKIFPAFWQSFKENFRQSTVIWLIALALELFIVWDVWLVYEGSFHPSSFVFWLLVIFFCLILMILNWALIMQSRYVNTIGTTLRNAGKMTLMHPGKSLMMLLLTVAPVILPILNSTTFAFIVVLGVSLFGFAQTVLYSPMFIKLEAALPDDDEEDDEQDADGGDDEGNDDDGENADE